MLATLDSYADITLLRSAGHYIAPGGAQPRAGWKLQGCEVEENPFGSSHPFAYKKTDDNTFDLQSVLRLIPGTNMIPGEVSENQKAGSALYHWQQGVARQYNETLALEDYRKKFRSLKNGHINPNNLVFCVAFDDSFTYFLPEQQMAQNPCAQPYGPEYTLINDVDVIKNNVAVKAWDPWFNVQGRKKIQVIYYQTPDGEHIYENPGPDDVAISVDLPPAYCKNPSPGGKTLDSQSQLWNLNTAEDYSSLDRDDSNIANIRCTDPSDPSKEQSATGKRDIAALKPNPQRQSSAGSFRDPNVFMYMGCGDLSTDPSDPDDGGASVDLCNDADNPCTDSGIPVGLFNGSPATADPLPGTEAGSPPTTSVPATTVTSGSGSRPALSYVFDIYSREVLVASGKTSQDTWAWEAITFDEATIDNADLCNYASNNPQAGVFFDNSNPTPTYPASLATVSLADHASCSYVGPDTATVGSIRCSDGMTAACTAAPAAQQTGYVDCSPDDAGGTGRVARDWWYFKEYCHYS